MLYPLKFKPQLLDKIWGGNTIQKWYEPASADMKNVGESWVVSAFDRYPTEVANGYLAGNELPDLLEVYMGELVGDKVYETFGNTFPLLVKFIDAADDLSIQVHPNNEQAWEKAESLGKTEMWYMMPGTSPSASILKGWKTHTSAEEVRAAIQNGTILSKLKEHAVVADDATLLEPGTVHTLKKGTIVAEIQENSDITYRLYDYDRTDQNGQKRQLHLEDALDVLNYEADTMGVKHVECKANQVANVEKTPYFTTNMLVATQTIQRDYAPLDSFVIYTCVEGAAEITSLEADKDATVALRMGEAVLIPAVLNDIQIKPVGGAVKLLETYID